MKNCLVLSSGKNKSRASSKASLIVFLGTVCKQEILNFFQTNLD